MIPDDAYTDAHGDLRCKACDEKRNHTPPVNVILILNPSKGKPYRLLPSEDYTMCANEECESIARFVRRAIDSHAMARQAFGANWWRIRFVFDDGEGWLVKNREYRQMAQA